MPLPVEGIERLGLAEFENAARARHPVGAVGVDEMADDIVNGPGILAFIAQRPFFGQIAQKRVERVGHALKQGDGVVEAVLHGNSYSRLRSACSMTFIISASGAGLPVQIS